MSLFDQGTVIIIGAGASVSFGLPTGLELLDLCVMSLQREAEYLATIYHPMVSVQPAASKAPVAFSYYNSGKLDLRLDASAAEGFFRGKADWLSKQTYDTIDDAIRNHPEDSKLLKILIAQALIQHTHSNFPETVYGVNKTLVGRKVGLRGDERNWIHSLVNIVRAQLLDDPSDFRVGRKIKIINFNYDCILERVIENVWSTSSEVQKLALDLERDPRNWMNVFEIVHPHGFMGSDILDFPAPELAQKLVAIANRIKVARDDALEDVEISRQRSRAKEMCESADEIYSMGFAFAKTNCDLLSLVRDGKDTSNFIVDQQKINYINYGGEYGLRDRVQRLAFPQDGLHPSGRRGRQVIERKDEAGGKLSIHQALVAGFLGEMPS
jgi:hypothetical protein